MIRENERMTRGRPCKAGHWGRFICREVRFPCPIHPTPWTCGATERTCLGSNECWGERGKRAARERSYEGALESGLQRREVKRGRG